MSEQTKLDDAAIMRIWRECGLPEYFLGNGGSNHKLTAFAEACGRLRAGSAGTEQADRWNGAIEAAAKVADEHEARWPKPTNDYASGCNYTAEQIAYEIRALAALPRREGTA